MFELTDTCPACGLSISSSEFQFCLKCGYNLRPDAVWMECCQRWVDTPWTQQFGYAIHCPHCGKRTGMKPPAQIEAAIEARKEQWREEEEQRKRVLHPPLLPEIKIQVRPEGNRLIDDLVEELNHYDRYPVAIADSVDQAKVLFNAFTKHAKRLITSEGQLIVDLPSREKRDLINDRFQRRQPVFTTVDVLPGLELNYSNRFILSVSDISDGFLKALARLASYGENQSRNAVVFEYQTSGLPERLTRYREEEATISHEKGGDENG